MPMWCHMLGLEPGPGLMALEPDVLRRLIFRSWLANKVQRHAHLPGVAMLL